MSINTTDLHDAVKSQAEKIVSSGSEVRSRLAEVFSQAAWQCQKSGEGLVAVIRATMDGAREGLEKSVPENRDDVLRQVVDALGDGLSKTALAGQLAVQEAVQSSRQYAGEDLTRLRDDLTAVQSLFTESVTRGLSASKALTSSQLTSAMTHAGRVAERLAPVFTGVLDAVRQHPVDFARESLQASVSVGQHAAGSLFQALGGLLQRAGDELRRESKPEK